MEEPDKQALGKTVCDTNEGQWVLDYPTENLIAICSGITVIEYCKPAFDGESVKLMFSDPATH